MASKGSARPSIEFATGQATIKGEDVMLVRPRVSFPKGTGGYRRLNSNDKTLSDSASSVHVNANGLQDSLPLEEPSRRNSFASLSRRHSTSLKSSGTSTFGLFCIFDGHNGEHAALHLQDLLLSTLEEKMPSGHPPLEHQEPAFTMWREALQRALVETFCDLNEAFACKGQLAGSTITVVIQYGWLLTVANCGDSRALLDTCHEILPLTVDHRISSHQADRRRLQALGAQIAPIDGSGSGPALSSVGYGPLRVWPGGLCLSRGIGDFDIGLPVIACPHIYQVRIPQSGGRLILASDGIWDGFENMKRFCRMSRNWACQVAPNKFIQALQRAFGGLRDDTSIVVLDILPPHTTFTEMAQRSPKRSPATAGSCFCFSPPVQEQRIDAADGHEKIHVHADLDIAAAVGLMPHSSQFEGPSWCTEEFCISISRSQEAACSAWSEARSMLVKGKTPSRQDLASFFSAVHSIRPLQDASKLDPHDLDVSTRPSTARAASLDDVTVRPRRSSGGFPSASAAEDQAAADGTQGDASTRFREHIADQLSFARKFGHYKHQLHGDGRSDEGSTTEEESMRAGSYHDPSNDSSQSDGISSRQTNAAEAGSFPSGGRVQSDCSQQRGRHCSLYQLDSAMLSSSGLLPTVEEEKPSAHRQSIGRLAAADAESAANPAIHEMAVRRGKNRFTPTGDEEHVEGCSTPKSPKPLVLQQVQAE